MIARPLAAASRALARYRELVVFEHTLFALPFAYLGTVFGSPAFPSARLLALVTVAMAGARTAAMAWNRIADRDVDAANPRTAGRPIPTGRVSVGGALALFAAGALALVLAARALNPLALLLSPLALALVTFYSHTKRFTALSHFVLGLCLAAAPAGGFIAAAGTLSPGILVLAAGVALWVAGFDILYALADIEFDRAAGLFSIPAKIGEARSLTLAALLHALATAAFAASGALLPAGAAWFAGCALAGALLAFGHRLARAGGEAGRARAFFHLNALVSAVLLAAGCADRLIGGARG